MSIPPPSPSSLPTTAESSASSSAAVRTWPGHFPYFAHRLAMLYHDDATKDWIILAENQVVPVHKFLLQHFMPNLAEEELKRPYISVDHFDIGVQAVRDLLELLYTGQITWDCARDKKRRMEMLYLARHFGMEEATLQSVRKVAIEVQHEVNPEMNGDEPRVEAVVKTKPKTTSRTLEVKQEFVKTKTKVKAAPAQNSEPVTVDEPTGGGSNVCGTCGKGFLTPGGLGAHQKGSGIYPCTVENCCSRFRREAARDNHVKMVHQEDLDDLEADIDLERSVRPKKRKVKRYTWQRKVNVLFQVFLSVSGRNSSANRDCR